MKRALLLALLMLSVFAGSAGAVNDPVVPGNECSASDTAVGHPASANNQTPESAANPPFSRNNPGADDNAREEDGAAAHEVEQGTDHCPNAPEE
jgi:hypothetical protein